MSTTETNGKQRSNVSDNSIDQTRSVDDHDILDCVRCTALSFGHLFSSLESSGSFIITCLSFELAQMNASACRRHK